LSFSPPCSGEGAYKKPPEAASRGLLIKKQNENGHTEKQSAPGMTNNRDSRPSQGFKEQLSIKQFKI
jgi:hypothetical protein